MEERSHVRLTPADRGRAVRHVAKAMQVEHRACRKPLDIAHARAALRRIPRRLAVMARVEHHGTHLWVLLADEALMGVELDGSIACTAGAVELPANVPDVATPEFAAGHARFRAEVATLAVQRAVELRAAERCGARARGRRPRHRRAARRRTGSTRAGPSGEPGEPEPHSRRGGAA